MQRSSAGAGFHPARQSATGIDAHSERATLRVGDVFLKVDTDQARIDEFVSPEGAVFSPADIQARFPRDVQPWTDLMQVWRGASS
jgi:hypothetical protein